MCKCNSEGVHKNYAFGDWCWLDEGHKEIDCVLANGKAVSKWSWSRCVDQVDQKGSTLLDCKGNFCLLIRNILSLKFRNTVALF